MPSKEGSINQYNLTSPSIFKLLISDNEKKSSQPIENSTEPSILKITFEITPDISKVESVLKETYLPKYSSIVVCAAAMMISSIDLIG